MSTDASLLEEYLRKHQTPAQALRDKPGLLDAAQKVGGMGTGLLSYQNEANTMRGALESAKNDPVAATNGIAQRLSPACRASPGGDNLQPWMDFSLLPPFDKVAQYFSFTI